MKKRLAVLSVALVQCLSAAVITTTAWADDPGTRYSEAFILFQQAQTAEQQSDLPTAYHKYHEALDILHAVRTDWPGWNSQMVEYRLRDCQSRFDAMKAKFPNGQPPVASAQRPMVVTPAVTISPTPPPQAPLPAATPPAVSAPQPANDQFAKLQKENAQLKTDLTEARRTAKSNSQVDKLTRENRDLKDQLAAAEKQAADAKAAASTESPEVKKLRADLDKARADTEQAKKSANQAATLEKQNKDLIAQLEAARKEASAKAAPPVVAPAADTAEVKKLQADNERARKQVTDLEKQLAEEKKAAEAATAAEPADARIMKHLRNENSYLRNLLDTYAASNPELKGQLHRHDQNQSKSSD